MATDPPTEVRSPLRGVVAALPVAPGARVAAATTLVVVESMKMEHVVAAGAEGVVAALRVAVGDQVEAGQVVAVVGPPPADRRAGPGGAAGDHPDEGAAPLGEQAHDDDQGGAGDGRADLAEVVERHRVGLDEARPEAVAKRRARGQRTARENVEDLCDPGTFVEYGALAIAAQRRRRDVEDLVEATPADGMVAGVGEVDGRRVVVAAYDFTVLAGTQGFQNHRKKDRVFELAERLELPVVLFAEGGGGRPGDVDAPGVSGLDVMAFHLFARLSGLVPLVGIVSGRCFAGNAALAGCCDVLIATEGSNLGMGGPAMIEGGGLGVVTPDEIGPLDVQVADGVVDVAVADEVEAVAVARRYLAYLAPGGPGEPATVPAPARSDWTCADQDELRHLVPERRVRVYDVRRVVDVLADEGSVLELRRGWGPGIVTALARIEGRPVGVVANDPAHLGGALDPDGCDKAARFLALCDAFGLPVVSLCDTPGFMVGPEVEAQAQVRHAARLFAVGANLSVPLVTVILRKGYGLGAQAMAGGSFKVPVACLAWPTGEVGGMGLEGAVRLGFRRELEAVEDPAEREALFEAMVAKAYEHGRALNAATHFEIDDVIDPADTRRVVTGVLADAPERPRHPGKRRPNVDLW
jgi:acetyl-CoA carboxylase carboxyltransferase component